MRKLNKKKVRWINELENEEKRRIIDKNSKEPKDNCKMGTRVVQKVIWTVDAVNYCNFKLPTGV